MKVGKIIESLELEKKSVVQTEGVLRSSILSDEEDVMKILSAMFELLSAEATRRNRWSLTSFFSGAVRMWMV